MGLFRCLSCAFGALLILLSTVSAQAQTAASELAHYWSLDEVSDVRWDAVGSAHILPFVKEPIVTTGKHNNGISGDPTGVGYNQAQNLSFGGSVSFVAAVWAKADATFAERTALYAVSGFELILNANNRIDLNVTPATGSSVTINTSAGDFNTTRFKLFWMKYNASTKVVSVAIEGGAWTNSSALADTLRRFTSLRFGSGYNNYRYGAVIDEVIMWTGYVPTDAERASIATSHTDLSYFGRTFTPPASPLQSITQIDTSFVRDTELTNQGTYWMRPYPLFQWSPSLAAIKGAYVWARSTDHASGDNDGLYIGYSASAGTPPTTWTLAKKGVGLRAETGNNWGQVETPELSYHPDDPDGMPYYMTAQSGNTTLTQYVTGTLPSQAIYQETVMLRSADLETWTYYKVLLPAFPRTYFPATADSMRNHTGYMTQLAWGDGTYRASSLINDSWTSTYTFTNALLPNGTRGSVTHNPGRLARGGWWTSTDARNWTLLYGAAPTERSLSQYFGYFTAGGKRYALNNFGSGALQHLRVYELNDNGLPVWPGWLVVARGTDTRWIQDTRIYTESGTAHIYVKRGYKEPNGVIQYYTATVQGSDETPPDAEYTYNSECLAVSGRVLLEDYGTLRPGVVADSTQRVANAAAINAAIAAVPAGGTLCLPSDSLYLTFDQAVAGGNPGNNHIRISRDSLTVWGAGACGWGNLSGCTYLATPGDADSYFYYGPDPNANGTTDVIRGAGIGFTMATSADSIRNITLKGFELDGHSGYTGDFSYNYDNDAVNALNGWDLSHKGITLGGGGRKLGNVLLEDIKVHHYKGEIIYLGGFEANTITTRRVWAYHSNGSSHNFGTAKNMLVENSKFGPNVRFWGEYLTEGIEGAAAIFRNNVYEGCMITAGCIAMAVQTPGATIHQTWTWTGNTFNLNGANYRTFLLTSGRPYNFVLTNNTFTGGAVWITGGGSTAKPDITMTGNTITGAGVDVFIWQAGDEKGTISNNTFSGTGKLWSVTATADRDSLTIEGNTFTGFSTPSASAAGVNPLTRNNTYASFTHSTTDLFNNTVQVAPSIEIKRITPQSANRLMELATSSADSQRVKLINASSTYSVTLDADSSQHGWAEDLVIAPTDTAEVIFDRSTLTWSLYDPGSEPVNVAPVAAFTSSCTYLNCTFTDASTDADGSITNRLWDFGDGYTATSTNPGHIYYGAGTYTVTLTVTDNSGATHDTTGNVTATELTIEFESDTLGGGSGSTTNPAPNRYSVTATGSTGIYTANRQGYRMSRLLVDGDSLEVEFDSVATWSGVGAWRQGGGIIVTDSTSSTSPSLIMHLYRRAQNLQVWADTSGSTVPYRHGGIITIMTPCRLKIVRSGEVYTPYYKKRNGEWVSMTPVTLNLTKPYIGVYAASHHSSNATTVYATVQNP